MSLIGLSQFGLAQKNDSLPERRNTIKLNLVTSMLYANSGAISFERVARTNQTWGVMLGYVQFPHLGSLGSSISSSTSNASNTGYVVGGEYRFYMIKENRFAAPHGVYWGPFTNYFSFKNGRELTYTPPSGIVSTAKLDTKLNVLNIGVQVGYQFLIKDRWVIDMVIFGPSFSYYGLDMALSGTIDESLLSSEIVKAMAERFPLVKELLSDQSANVHGTTSQWGTGFRYQLNVGYHFGGKKKK
jgi:hypothetical protein